MRKSSINAGCLKGTSMNWLVVWNIFLFSHILGIIIPIDFHIFQRGSNHQPDEMDNSLIPDLLRTSKLKIPLGIQ